MIVAGNGMTIVDYDDLIAFLRRKHGFMRVGIGKCHQSQDERGQDEKPTGDSRHHKPEGLG